MGLRHLVWCVAFQTASDMSEKICPREIEWVRGVKPPSRPRRWLRGPTTRRPPKKDPETHCHRRRSACCGLRAGRARDSRSGNICFDEEMIVNFREPIREYGRMLLLREGRNFRPIS